MALHNTTTTISICVSTITHLLCVCVISFSLSFHPTSFLTLGIEPLKRQPYICWDKYKMNMNMIDGRKIPTRVCMSCQAIRTVHCIQWVCPFFCMASPQRETFWSNYKANTHIKHTHTHTLSLSLFFWLSASAVRFAALFQPLLLIVIWRSQGHLFIVPKKMNWVVLCFTC